MVAEVNHLERPLELKFLLYDGQGDIPQFPAFIVYFGTGSIMLATQVPQEQMQHIVWGGPGEGPLDMFQRYLIPAKWVTRWDAASRSTCYFGEVPLVTVPHESVSLPVLEGG